MKLLSTVAAGALLLAGCAPFEHGHYAADSHFINDFGDRSGTPVLYDTNSDYAATATTVETVDHHQTHAVPAPIYTTQAPVYSDPAPVQVAYEPPPVQVIASAPVRIHEPHYPEPAHYQEPVRHIEPTHYVEPQRQPYAVLPEPPVPSIPHYDYHQPEPVHAPVVQYAPPPPPPPAPVVAYTPPPVPVAAATSVSVNVNVDGNRYDTPTVVAPQRRVVEERYIGETQYAPPEVVNMPPIYMRNGQQYSNQPYPAPGIPQFAAPAPFPVPPNFGYPPQPPVFGGGYGGPVAANMRPAFQNGFNGGYNTPYGAGCVTSCMGSSSVF